MYIINVETNEPNQPKDLKMNMTKESATAKANDVKAMINTLETMKAHYLKACEVVGKFENKVINARFTTALNNHIDDSNARFILNGSQHAFEFRVYGTANRKWHEDLAVYQFYSFTGGLAEVRTHNIETGLNNKFVVLFKTEDQNRINAEGWIELFKSRADLMQKQIEDRLPFTNPETILKASAEEDRIEAEIRKLNDEKAKCMPYFLRR
jgi:hypothetical protein